MLFRSVSQSRYSGYGNTRFEVNAEEGLDFVEEFYVDENAESEHSPLESKAKTKTKFTQSKGFVQDIQQGLQQSVKALN